MHPVLFQIGSLVVPSYGAVAALGVLLALALAQSTSHQTNFDSRHSWNILVLAVFSSIAASRLLLILMNLGDLRHHPQWLLAIAMVHHPLLAAVGIAASVAATLLYARWAKLSLKVIGDCLAAPVAVGYGAEQLGALLAGSDYGRDSSATSFLSSVVYTNPIAARWSATPLGVSLYPVQAYAAIGAVLLAAITYAWLFRRRRSGDVAGIWMIGFGALLFGSEIFRDWEGRGVMLGGLIDAPQLVGLGLVLLGGLVLWNWHPDSTARKA